MRILGLDYGSKTVGVAVSDSLCLTAQAVETITRNSENKLRRTLARIEALVKEYEVSLIVLGLPLLWNNDMAERAQETAIFRDMLERRTGLKVVYQDERLTTDEAERTLIESGIRRENRKKYIDQIAAVLILQSYLDRINNQEK
ncbi:MAG: Holliday junction resolvase RuvX [Lachnospiraceae bacterium]|nr:Holliday junction resolvase RuvX [Lachnospiraceae bacterium]